MISLNKSISLLEEGEYAKVTHLARGFCSNEASFLGFNGAHFKSQCNALHSAGMLRCLVLKNNDKLTGMLAFMIAPTLVNTDVVATELAWYVLPEHRGDRKSLYLLDKYLEIALEEGCKYATMVHLQDSMPEALKKLYEKKGFVLLEQQYVKYF